MNRSRGGQAKGQGSGNVQSVHIEGDAKGNAFVQGNRNRTKVKYTEVSLPPPESVDIQQELEALRSILAGLRSDDRPKIDNRLEEAIDEAGGEEPDKDAVGRALEGALKYAKKANDFSEVAEDLIPRITKVCGWLGKFGAPLLALMGLSI